MMYQASKTLRNGMLPHSGGWSISEAILSTGQATANNLPAKLSDLQYMIRVPTVEIAKKVTVALERNAEVAATMIGCRWKKHWVLQITTWFSKPRNIQYCLVSNANRCFSNLGEKAIRVA